MGKRFSLFFAVLLIFQTITSSLAFPSHINAEETDASIFDGVSLTDENDDDVTEENLNEESNVYVHIDWSISGVDVEAGDEESLVINSPLEATKAEGVLTVDNAADIGTYGVSEDGVLTVTFADTVEEHPDANGTIVIEADVVIEDDEVDESTENNSDENNSEENSTEENSDNNSEANNQTEENTDSNDNAEEDNAPDLDEDAESDKAPDNESNEDSEADENEVEVNKANILAEEPKEITENIIEDFKLLKKDGTAFEDDELIEVDEDLRFELDWALTNNDHEYQAGDYFEFQLPKELTVHNKIEDGSLGDYGSFEVDLEGNVKLTFNEKIEEESNVKGEFFFDTELREELIKSTNENLEVIFNDEVAKRISINVKPTSGQAIHKEGQPVDGNFNTEEIEWTVDINTTRDSLKNAIVNDPILDGQELDLDSIVLEEVEVNLAGEVVENLGKVDEFTNNSTKEELKIELDDTNKAYQLTFTTTMTEDEKDNEGTKKYNNTVYLNSDDQTEKESGASVSVDRPKSMEKTSSNFNKGDRSVEWTVNANFNEKNLSAGDEIKDEFNFTVGNENFNDIFNIVKEDITVEQVDQFNDKGKPTKKSDATNLFEITVEGNKVTYKLKEDSNKAFVLNYKTKAKDGKIINENGTIVNNVNLNGNTSESSQGIVQQVGTKTNAGIDYENKTIDWTITINADKQDLKNFILKDDFAGSGQKLVEDSIEISPTNDTASITPNGDLEGFEIDFGDIIDSYKITYQTEFTYDFDEGKTPNFKNGVDITYETSDGNDYELEIGDQVNPNKQTKSNGAKNGKANNDTKLMTWTVDINYNQLDLTGAEVVDEIADNQSLIDGSMKVYETTIGSGGKVNVGTDVTDQFTTIAEENLVKVDFGAIDQSYRVEFVTKDKDDLYNSDEKYTNTAQFKPGDGKTHDLKANVTLPNQGEFLGKKGLHNKEDWTIDWEIDVNKSKSTITDVTVDDDLGSTDAQILLEDSIKVTKKGSNDGLVEGEDYNLSIDGNKLSVNFPGEITDHYVVNYSSYIVAEEDIDIDNEAEITSVDEIIVGSTEKTETVSIKFSTGGGTGEGETGGLTINKSESGSDRALEDIEFELVKTIGSEDIVVREGKTDADGKLAWKGLKFGDYTLNEVIPDGYLGEETQTVNVSSNEYNNVNLLPIENERETGTAKIIKVDSITGETLQGAEFELTNQTTGMDYTLTTEADGVVEEEIPFGEYTVKEINAPEGYRITENIESITVDIDETTEIEVENVAFVNVSGEKTWYVDEGTDLPESITVKLFADGKEIDKEVVTSADDWKYSFEDLDKYSRANKDINYEIEEVEIGGYEVQQDRYDLTNIELTTISGSKTWVDDNDFSNKRPESITVQVKNGDDVVKEKEVTADNGWTYTFEDLPKYDKSGEEITYTIDETSIDGYKKNVDGYNLENIRQETRSVEVNKTWKDEVPTDRPDSIEVSLTREVKGEKDTDFVTQTETIKPDGQGNWTYVFEDLDAYNEIGEAYEYIIKEDNVPAKYESTVNYHDIENVRIGETEVSGTKRWKDDKIDDRPDEITVNLLRNKVVIDSKDVTADDNWDFEFTKLDKYDKDGKYYEYEIKEEQVPGYAPKIIGDDITNTRSEKTSIEITKGWLDDDSEDRPDSVIVYVNQNGELFDTVNVEASDDWVYELTGLEAYDEDGQPYTYEIIEKPVEGYETTIDGFNITNLRVGETEVSGEKTWKDNDDATSNRPESITVNLLQNGKEIDSQEVTADDNWKYSFEELAKYDNQGVEWGYTIDEVDVDGYEKSGDGTNLTNTRTGITEVTGEKFWQDNDDATGDRPETITVKLLQNGELFTQTEVTEEDDWEYSFTHLPEFDEDGVAYGYTVDEFDVDRYEKSAGDGYNLINTRVGTTEVSGEKIWQDNDDATGDRPDSITVNLLQNGTIFAVTEATAENDWEYSFKNLPRFDENGVEWGYTIDEVGVDGYAKSTNGNDLVNTRTGTTEVTGKKIWRDNNNATDDRPDEITVNVLQNGTIFAVEKVTSDEDGNWTYTFENLPRFDDNGVEWGYTIDEEPVKGYAKSTDGNDLVNTRVGTTEVSGEKTWQDNDDATGDRPDSITVNLLQNGTIFAVEKVTPDEDDNWTYTFENLPRFDDNGVEWGYTIDEEPVKSYAKSTDGNDLVNTRVGTTEVSGGKIWEDNEDATGDRPDSITVQLLQNGEVVEETETTAEDNWKYSFDNIDRFDENGVEWGYTIDEKPVYGYEKSAGENNDLINTRTGTTEIAGTKTWLDDGAVENRPESITVNLLQNGEIFAVEEVTADEDGNWEYSFDNVPRFDENGVEWGYTIDEVDVEGYAKSGDGNNLTNTRVGETEVSGAKTWLDNDDATGDRPDLITVELLQNGELFTTAEVTADEDWVYSFTHLPKYDDQGVAYDYTIEEIVPENYEAMVDGFDITNVRVGTTEVAGEKTWNEVDDQYRPDSITANLLANGEEVDTVEVSKETNWTYEFTDLPEFDSKGKEIEYTIEEVDVKGYTSEIEGYDITNTQVTTELSVTKTWADEDDETGDRPESITVQVMNDEDVVDEQEVTAEDSWSFTFTDLPKYDKEGKEIEYTINELPVPGYATDIEGTDIMNTRAKQVTVEGTKTWKDADSTDRPDAITVHVLANGEVVNTIEVTAEEDWVYEVKDLEAYDEDGIAIKYTIEEDDVDGYETDINGFNITNLRVGTTSVEGMKTWKGDDASDRPTSIVVELLRNGEVVDQVDVTAETDWTYSFTDLDEFDENGKVYVYTIVEQEVEGYTSVVDGYDLINTLDPQDPVKPEDPEKPVTPEDPSDNPKDPEDPSSGDGEELPTTATNVFNLLLIGFGLVLIGFISLFMRRRKFN